MILATKNNVHVLLDLAFLAQKNWSGGKARSVQLLEIFEKAGFTTSSVKEPNRPKSLVIICYAMLGIVQFGIFQPFCVMGLRTLGYQMFLSKWIANSFPTVSTVVIEGTGFGRLQIVPMLQKFGKKVILIPANVESLASYPDAWTHQLPVTKRLSVEAKYYCIADAVFCISTEETWLLQVIGTNAYFLPYFPPGEILKKIEQRKKDRENTIKSGYLYFADFRNAPNVKGFAAFVQQRLYIGMKIQVAGLGAESIKPLTDGIAEFDYLGELSSDALEERLLHCEKVILHHYPTSGMLTRVTDLLLSDIPIEGNFAALKGYSFISTINFGSSSLSRLLKEFSDQRNCHLIQEIESI